MATIINVAEIASPDWRFLESDLPNHEWHHFSASQRSSIERWITRPKLSRARACWQALQHLRSGGEVVISHLPKTSHWFATAMRLSGRPRRHLAFSFNFTRLPEGGQRLRMSRSFGSVDRFVVYSRFERKLYADHFGLPLDRMDYLPWSMQTPRVDPTVATSVSGAYCAAGGEGRDYRCLVEAFQRMPTLRLIVVCRPNSLRGVDIPPNVEVRFNASLLDYWSIVQGAKAVLVPLLDERTACGHITVVGSMTLGRAIVSTESAGVQDYLRDGENALLVAPKDVDAWIRAVQRLEDEPQLSKQLGNAGRRLAHINCSPMTWVRYVETFIAHARDNHAGEHFRSENS